MSLLHKNSKAYKDQQNCKDYVLPPVPREDDDLLSHYASPKCNYDPLPLDLFPRPDREEELRQVACFPCFKYYDVSKFKSLQEARLLSAMDIIPKDALKKSDQQHAQRSKRSKRVTTESTHLAGYYRNKHEGVKWGYGVGKEGAHADAVTLAVGTKTRRAQQLAAQSHSGVEVEIPYPAVGTSTRQAPAAMPGPSKTSEYNLLPGPPAPKKQGNRLEFLASLRRQLQPADEKCQSGASYPPPSKPLTMKKIQRSAAGHMTRRGRPRERYDDDRGSVHSSIDSMSTGKESAAGSGDEKGEELDENAKLRPAWMPDDDEDADDEAAVDKSALKKLNKVALNFIANEELGASDDDGGF